MSKNQKRTGQISLTRLAHVIMEKKGKSGLTNQIQLPPQKLRPPQAVSNHIAP